MNFKEKYGFERSEVTLGNWREQPFNYWSFQHVNEIVPSALVPAYHVQPLAVKPSEKAVDGISVALDQRAVLLKDFLQQSHSNHFLVSHKGQKLFDWHAKSANPDLPHIVFSISKSLSGLLAGILQDQLYLDVSRQIGFYLPEMQGSAYADCSLQDLLDMRVSLDFEEEYLNKDGDYARYRRSTGWNPALPNADNPGMLEFLQSLKKGAAPHGGKFTYRSPNSDLLGILLERVSGQSFAEIFSAHLWQPLKARCDAFITVDKAGAPRSAGGISVVADDLLKVGELLCNNGEYQGTGILSERWMHDMRRNGDAAAWASGDFADFLPGARYRNQWYQLGAPEGVVMAVGIHGQWLYCDTQNNVVIVKLSSQPVPQDDQLDARCLSVFGQIVRLIT